MSEHSKDRIIGSVVDQARGAGHGASISIEDVLRQLGPSSFAPALLLVSLLIVTPLSGIPGLSAISGLTIALIAAQLLIGRNHLWLPKFIMRRKIPRDRFEKALSWLDKPIGWLDAITANRLSFMTSKPVSYVSYLICMVIGGVMPFLELVPFTSSLMAFAVALLSVGLIARDGVFTVVALIYLAAIFLFITTIAQSLFQ